MSNIPLCPEHQTAMKVSKHDPDGFYCPKVIGTHPQSGEKLYCTHTATATATPVAPPQRLSNVPPPAPPTTTSVQPTTSFVQPPPPVRYANGNGEGIKNRRTALITAGQFLGDGAHNVDHLLAAADKFLAWLENKPSPAKGGEPAHGAGTEGGLTKLMEDANVELGLRGFEPHYKHAIHVKNALKELGHASYKPTMHKQYVHQLVARVEAKEINGEDEIPF